MEHTEQMNGYRLSVYRDEDPSNPREDCDYDSHMICFHHRYGLGDKHTYRYPEELTKVIPEDAIKLPVYLMDHSSLSVSTTPFGCSWDSGQIGWIYITPEGIMAEQGDLSERAMEQARKNLIAEVAEYDQYLNGDIYRYKIEKINVCDCCGHTRYELSDDDCGPLYGLEHAIEEGQAALKAFAETEPLEAVIL